MRKRTTSVVPRIGLRLYVADGSPHSRAAEANLKAIRDREDGDRIDVEVVNVSRMPMRAVEDGIYLTPTLVRLSPLPRAFLIGALHDADELRRFLALGSSGGQRD
jgi:circadian clock protein KaiB